MSETHRCDFDVFWFISIFSQTALSIKSEWWWLGWWRRGAFWTENYQLLIHNLWFSVDRKNDDNNKKFLRTRKLKTATTTNKTSSERKIIGLNVSLFFICSLKANTWNSSVGAPVAEQCTAKNRNIRQKWNVKLCHCSSSEMMRTFSFVNRARAGVRRLINKTFFSLSF